MFLFDMLVVKFVYLPSAPNCLFDFLSCPATGPGSVSFSGAGVLF